MVQGVFSETTFNLFIFFNIHVGRSSFHWLQPTENAANSSTPISTDVRALVGKIDRMA